MKQKPSRTLLLALIPTIIGMWKVDAQVPDAVDSTRIHRNTIELSPLSPFIHIYVLQYAFRVSPGDELIAGLSYMNIRYDFGSTHAPAFIAGYRRFVWKNLHIEYQVWPAYDSFYEKNEGKYYRSFDVWNELRLGYQFDLDVSGVPAFISVQWPFGFGLYASNKPQSFKDHENENRFFYFPPLLFVGIRF